MTGQHVRRSSEGSHAPPDRIARHRLLALGAALAVGIVSGCGGDDDAPDVTTPGLANPASVYCVEQGGEVEIVDEGSGQVGYCLLPDGRRIEEWEFFRAETGTTTEP